MWLPQWLEQYKEAEMPTSLKWIGGTSIGAACVYLVYIVLTVTMPRMTGDVSSALAEFRTDLKSSITELNAGADRRVERNATAFEQSIKAMVEEIRSDRTDIQDGFEKISETIDANMKENNQTQKVFLNKMLKLQEETGS